MRVNLRVLSEIEAQCKAWKVDLLHANSYAVGIAPALVESGRLPLVWHLRELPEAHYGMVFDGGPSRAKRALEGAAARIAISDTVLHDVRCRIAPDSVVHRVYDGVYDEGELASLRASATTRMSSSPMFTFLMVGLIHPSKGQLEAVEALAHLRDKGRNARLILVGGGRAEVLESRVRELRLDNMVEFVGYQPSTDPYYAVADVYLACSRHEALGRSTIEAMAHGVPIIALRSGAHPEVLMADDKALTNEPCGILYDGGAHDLADRMCYLMDDSERRMELSVQALSAVAGRFCRGACATSVSAIFHSVIAARNGHR
jgi:glycosyltransferase involved in cell wall biosynthesis